MFGISGMQVLLAVAVALPQCSGVLDDAATGLHWRFENSVSGGPGKLVQTVDTVSCRRGFAGVRGSSRGSERLSEVRSVVIRKGDAVLVLQESNVVHAELSGIALSEGAPGDSIRVRLRFAAKVVRATISGPGRAVLPGGRNEAHR